MLNWSLRRGPAAFLACCALLLTVLLTLLGACGRDGGSPVAPVLELALFGDAEVDAAALALPSVRMEVVGREFEALTDLVEARP